MKTIIYETVLRETSLCFKYSSSSQDWEFPGARDRDAAPDSQVKFNILVKELRQAFEDHAIRTNKTNRLILTAAVAADPKKIDQGYIVAEFCK